MPVHPLWTVVCLLGLAHAAHAQQALEEEGDEVRWRVGQPLLEPGGQGAFDETAVKDPTIVFHGGRWHLFYTACAPSGYSVGYASGERIEDLQRGKHVQLSQVRGRNEAYAAAPQVFFLDTRQTWYLVAQTRDGNYQPVYATTKTIDDPASWSEATDLVRKDDEAKWIDFWVICDGAHAYLFLTRNHRDVCVMTTKIEDFPRGFGRPQTVFSPVHEAVHVYKAQGTGHYHLFYETRAENGLRSYGLAQASTLPGQWTRMTENFATGTQLDYPPGVPRWTDQVSHGEMIRTGYNQNLEYDPRQPRFLIQGLPAREHVGDYSRLPWRLGIISRQ